MEKTNISLLLFLFSLTSLCNSQSDDYDYDTYNYDQYNYDQNNYDEYDYNEKYDYYGHQNLIAPAPLPIQPPSQPGYYIFCYLVCSIIILLGISNSYHYLMYHSFCWTILGCHRKTLKDYPNQANSSAGTEVEILDFSDLTKNAPCLMIYIHPNLSVQEGF